MKVLGGCYSTAAAATTKHLAERQSDALQGYPGQFRQARCDIGALGTRDGDTHRDDQLVTAIVGHPRWRNDDLADLARSAGHAAALAESYRRRGPAFVDMLAGAFAAAVIDPAHGQAVVAIDRTGQFPLYYAAVGECLAFGTSAAPVFCQLGLGREISNDGVFNYLYFHMVPSHVSIFRGIRKLQAGQRLVATTTGIDVQQYWLPRFEEPSDFSVAETGSALREALGHSVAALVDQPATTGAFLSGGLDSSSVAGMLAREHPEANSFSIGFDAEGYDEMAFARIASRHFGTRANEYYVTPEDVLDAVPHIAASYEEPFGNSSALPAYFCARRAVERGMHRLLAGDGGDELFGGNARYAKQDIFELWHRLPSGLRGALLEPAALRLPTLPAPLRKVRSYVEQARMPLPDRLQSYNFLHRLQLTEIFDADFLASVDTQSPLDAMRDIYNRPEDASTLNRMLYLDWQHTLADNDLRKVRQMCDIAGIDVTFPMLDDALIELSLRVPSNQKIRRGRLRHFYKEAFRDFLPGEIIDKRKHGFGLPFGVWMQTHAPLREMAFDSLLRMKGRNIVRAAFLDRLIQLHRDGHAAYFGEMIWILMMLDLWLANGRADQEGAVAAAAGTRG